MGAPPPDTKALLARVSAERLRRLAVLEALVGLERALADSIEAMLRPVTPEPSGWLARLAAAIADRDALAAVAPAPGPEHRRLSVFTQVRALSHHLDALGSELSLLSSDIDALERAGLGEQAALHRALMSAFERVRGVLERLHQMGSEALEGARSAAPAARGAQSQLAWLAVGALAGEGAVYLAEDVSALERRAARLDREAEARRVAREEVERALDDAP